MLDLDVWRREHRGEFGRHVRVVTRFFDRVEHLEGELCREVERATEYTLQMLDAIDEATTRT